MMQRTEATQGEKFLDVIKNIEGMTSSQQRFIQEMLSKRKQAPAFPKKRILKKSFGLWADRGDIKSSMDYVNQLRSEWQSLTKAQTGCREVAALNGVTERVHVGGLFQGSDFAAYAGRKT